MRLSAHEVGVIRDAVHSRDPEAVIYLYGSRVDDRLRGGDIDLLVLSDALTFSDKLDVLVEVKMRLGDQKIDLSIKAHCCQNDPFVVSILQHAQKIERV